MKLQYTLLSLQFMTYYYLLPIIELVSCEHEDCIFMFLSFYGKGKVW